MGFHQLFQEAAIVGNKHSGHVPSMLQWKGNHLTFIFQQQLYKKVVVGHDRNSRSRSMEDTKQTTTKTRWRHQDGSTGDITKVISKFTKWASYWGLYWVLLASFSWHIWSERNRKLRQKILRPPEQIIKEATKDISIFLNVASFKKSNQSLVELNLQKAWGKHSEANIL